MVRLLTLLSLACLAACTDPPRADWDRQSEAACRSRGLTEGSSPYLDCRMAFAHQHARQFGVDEPLRHAAERK